MYVGFMDLEKAHDEINMDALRQVLKICNVGGKLLKGIGIKSMYVDKLACVKVNGVRVSSLG